MSTTLLMGRMPALCSRSWIDRGDGDLHIPNYHTGIAITEVRRGNLDRHVIGDIAIAAGMRFIRWQVQRCAVSAATSARHADHAQAARHVEGQAQ